MAANIDIAVIGIGCWYPGAKTPTELWENVLAKKQQFRRTLDKRLPIADYTASDPQAPDKTYGTKAAYIDGFEFDWMKNRIPKSTYDSTDVVHWLALDVAKKALSDAGIDLDRVDRTKMGVILGNTLTGEHTRSTGLRLRWPFIRRALQATATEMGLPPSVTTELSKNMELTFKSAFPAITEDTLAGGLSNTIAGRICNYLDLNGGGYTVDGACASSLISVYTAAEMLGSGNLDLALAGGVDISLDPFELVGFSKVGALARNDMRVFDKRAEGFFPGEGCGFVVLKRLQEARDSGDYVYAVLRGWGMSTDGRGGVTAPTVNGQTISLQRAYAKAAYDCADIDFVETHGTGTPIGDPIELEAIANAANNGGEVVPRSCGVTSFKSIVGHTKAAAGIGGFIKATIAVNRRVIPPMAGISEPNAIFDDKASCLYPVLHGEIRPNNTRVRAGISGMGFGGINLHTTIESADPPASKLSPSVNERALMASDQDTELFFLSAPDPEEMTNAIARMKRIARDISVAEMVDYSAYLIKTLDRPSLLRAAVIASSPEQLVDKLDALTTMLQSSQLAEGDMRVSPLQDVWLAKEVRCPKIGFLFPGQGAQRLNMCRSIVQRHPWAQRLVADAEEYVGLLDSDLLEKLIYRPVERAKDKQEIKSWEKTLAETSVAQPAIVLWSLLWLKRLERLGISPSCVGGHSLGEITGFYASGAMTNEQLFRLVAKRGQVMSADSADRGAMAAFSCSRHMVEEIIDRVDNYLTIANLNSPEQIVISGDRPGIEKAISLAETQGIRAKLLPVSNAFHSKYMERASEELGNATKELGAFRQSSIDIYSAIDGKKLTDEVDLSDYFSRQMVSEVDFVSLVESVSQQCDLLVEVGPGSILTRLVNDMVPEDGPDCFPVESTPGEFNDLNKLLSRYFVSGGNINFDNLFEDRLVRLFFSLEEMSFIENPCENELKVPVCQKKVDITPSDLSIVASAETMPEIPRKDEFDNESDSGPRSADDENDVQQTLIDHISERTGFPKESITSEAKLLTDLNLDSIKAGELITLVANEYNVAGKIDPASLAQASIREIAEAIDKESALLGDPAEHRISQAEGVLDKLPESIAGETWVRNFIIKQIPLPLPGNIASDHKAAQSKLWENAKLLLLHEPEDGPIASAIESVAGARGIFTESILFDQTNGSGIPEEAFTHLICILPRSNKEETLPVEMVHNTVRRLRTGVFVSKAVQGIENVAFIQFGNGSPQETILEQTGAAAFAATLHHEQPDLTIRVVDFDPNVEDANISRLVLDELSVAEDTYVWASYDTDLVRHVPVPYLHEKSSLSERKITWSENDVVLVTGGAKGITAECAFQLARQFHVKVALVGRSSHPGTDGDAKESEVGQCLNRYEEHELTCRYFSCDVSDLSQVKDTVEHVTQELGPITAVVHGAGTNTPRRVDTVSLKEAYSEISPKVLGAINLCHALRRNPPKLFVGLASIIGVTGMPGNAWYAYSNESLNLILRQFSAEHRNTSAVSLAYSVWDEVGMGVRMGSVEYLSKMGISPIPVSDGVQRFIDAFKYDYGSPEVVITARIGGLDTWRPEWKGKPLASRYIEKLVTIQPNVEAVCLAHLDIERDRYLKDHYYQKSYLFPTVHGLEAMAQCVSVVTGILKFDHIRVENILLERPITVDEHNGEDILVHAQVQERNTSDEPLRIHVSILPAKTAFSYKHFSATFVLSDDFHEEENQDDEFAIPPKLDIEPLRDLYGRFLFQGPLFQRIKEIRLLSTEKSILLSERRPFDNKLNDETYILGDPYFRDSLLQLGQLVFPYLKALPRFIRCLEIAQVNSTTSSAVPVFARLNRKTDELIDATISAEDDSGRKLEYLDHCEFSILGVDDNEPRVEDLVHPNNRDKRLLDQKIRGLAQQFDLSPPRIVIGNIPELSNMESQEHRRKLERPLVQEVVKKVIEDMRLRSSVQRLVGMVLKGMGHRNGAIEFDHTENGRPVLSGKYKKKLGISLSHDERFCIVVSGEGPQGCDIEPVSTRTESDWLGLLGLHRKKLFQDLLIHDTKDIAGARIWSAREALYKACNTQNIPISVLHRQGEVVLFSSTINESTYYVLTFPAKLTFGNQRMLSLVVRKQKNVLRFNRSRLSRQYLGKVFEHNIIGFIKSLFHLKLGYDPTTYGMSGKFRKKILTLRWPVSFKESANLNKSIYFTHFLDWMGKTRETAMQPVEEAFAKQMMTGKWGMVTNYTDLQILGDTNIGDVIEVDFWVERASEHPDNSVDMNFDWRRLPKKGEPERIARGKMGVTWVRILEHGKVKAEPFPDYLQDFIGNRLQPSNNPYVPVERRESFANMDLGEPLYMETVANSLEARNILQEETFKTALIHGNLVGNIYFSNYFSWQGIVRDHYFYSVIPDYYKASVSKGELICLDARVDHLLDAMPFEAINVEMSLKGLYEKGLILRFEYYRKLPNGKQKLAYGEHKAAWMTRTADGTSVPSALPEEIRNGFRTIATQPYDAYGG